MAINIGDSVGGGTVGSVLFVGAGTVLAQNNFGFFYDAATNTLKSRDQANSDSGSFAIGTGDVAGSSTGGSGTLTIETGDGSPNTSGTDAAGNSGAVTINTGAGGDSDSGSAAGNSGNLNLKTGSGGGNAFSGATGGNAGHIILQPGSGGSGSTSGVGGSTFVRSSNSGDILAVQNSAGTTTHVGVSNSGNLRVGAASSSALLHLGAGTATLPPLRLSSGTLLTSPAAGAVEWDGSKLYLTLSSGARRALEYASNITNVLDFGAKGDGTNDSAAIQAAVNSLVNANTGGVVYFPPNLKYGIGSTVTIRSQYPISLVSRMGGWNNDNVTEEGYIQPIAQLDDGMFRWVKVADTDPFDFAGGGGAIGLKIMQPRLSKRTYSIHSAIRLDNGANFLIRDCEFYYLQGRVFYAGEWGNNTFIQRIDVSECGASGKPMIDLQTPVNQGYFHIADSELEINYGASYIRVPVGGVYLQNVGFEADPSVTADQTFVDATNGPLFAQGCSFRRNQATHVVIGQLTGSAGTRSMILNSSFHAATGKTTKSLHVLPSAANSQFANLTFIGTSTQQAQQIHIEASSCKLSDVYLQEGGNVDLAGLNCQATNVHCFALQTTESACIKGVGGCSIVNCQVDGNSNATPTHGISVSGTTPKVIGCEVRNLAANKDGIITTSNNAVIADNFVYGLSGTGRPYVWASGALARNNGGYAVTISAVAGAATLHAEAGIIESDPITTPAGGTYTLVLTNALIGTSSRILATVQRGTESQSLSYQVQEVFPALNTCWIIVKNTGGVPFSNGNPPPNNAATIKIHFLVQN
ncbi:MAG: glycosyl hydrolase family 28-related protein [Pirellulales bacterium]